MLSRAGEWSNCHYVWQMNAAYVLSGGVLVAVALAVGWNARAGRRRTRGL